MSAKPNDSVDDRELQTALANRLRDWRVSGNILERTFECQDFVTTLEFVNRVGEKAEEMNHHPDIDIRYNKVTFHLTSHDAGGITRRDLNLAGYINGVAPAFSQKRKTA